MPSHCLFMHSQHLELNRADVTAAWYSLCLLVPAYWNDLNSVNCNTKCYTLKTHSTLQKTNKKKTIIKNNKYTYSPINYMKESLCVCVRACAEVCFDCCLVLCFVMGCAPIQWKKHIKRVHYYYENRRLKLLKSTPQAQSFHKQTDISNRTKELPSTRTMKTPTQGLETNSNTLAPPTPALRNNESMHCVWVKTDGFPYLGKTSLAGSDSLGASRTSPVRWSFLANSPTCVRTDQTTQCHYFLHAHT